MLFDSLIGEKREVEELPSRNSPPMIFQPVANKNVSPIRTRPFQASKRSGSRQNSDRQQASDQYMIRYL